MRPVMILELYASVFRGLTHCFVAVVFTHFLIHLFIYFCMFVCLLNRYPLIGVIVNFWAQLRGVFRQKRPILEKSFKYYARARPGNIETMDKNEFMDFVKDCRLIDNKLAVTDVYAIFANIQHGHDEEAIASTGLELTYTEFLEGICALAGYKYPNPYVPLDKKVSLGIRCNEKCTYACGFASLGRVLHSRICHYKHSGQGWPAEFGGEKEHKWCRIACDA